jgi:hypothetical protein
MSNRPLIHVQPARPALVLAAANGSYILNKDGRVLAMKENLPPNNKLSGVPFVTDQSSLRVKLNQQALTGDDIKFIRTIIAQLSAKGIKYDSLVLPAGSRQLDVKITGKPYFVKFNLQDVSKVQEQAGTYLATEKELAKRGITPAQYIDVRLEGRAYYR